MKKKNLDVFYLDLDVSRHFKTQNDQSQLAVFALDACPDLMNLLVVACPLESRRS